MNLAALAVLVNKVSLLKPKFAASTRRPIWFCLVLGIAILQRNNLTACESWRARRRERYTVDAPLSTLGWLTLGARYCWQSFIF